MRIWSWHVHRDSNDICFSHFYRSHLGEVEHDVDEDERDSQHEDPKDQVESQEPGKKHGEYFQTHKLKNWAKNSHKNTKKSWKTRQRCEEKPKMWGKARNLLLLSLRMSTCSGDRSVYVTFGWNIRFQVMKETRIHVQRQKWFLVEDIEDADRKWGKRTWWSVPRHWHILMVEVLALCIDWTRPEAGFDVYNRLYTASHGTEWTEMDNLPGPSMSRSHRQGFWGGQGQEAEKGKIF